jgi:hypothetical protein
MLLIYVQLWRICFFVHWTGRSTIAVVCMKKLERATMKMLLCSCRPDVKKVLRNSRKYLKFLGLRKYNRGFPKPWRLQNSWRCRCLKTSFELDKITNSQNDGVLRYKDGLYMDHPSANGLNHLHLPKRRRWSWKSIKWPEAIKRRQPSPLFISML